MIMGLGMGFTMSPMSTAAMNAVRPEKAGAASGMLSMSRMLGGTFGVAAVGALFQHLSSDRLAAKLSGLHLTAAQKADIGAAMGTGGAKHVLSGLDPHTASQAGAAMRDGFVHGLSGALTLSSGVALVGVAIAFTLVESKKRLSRTASVTPVEPTAPVPEQIAA
jgi:hypothetical protein